MTKGNSEKAERLGEFFASVFTNEIEELWDLANKPESKKKIKLVIDKEIILRDYVNLKYLNPQAPTVYTLGFFTKLEKNWWMCWW